MHYYALIKYKYALKEKWIEICKNMQHKFLISSSIGHKTNFYPTLHLLLFKEKDMQMHEHPPFIHCMCNNCTSNNFKGSTNIKIPL